MSVFAFKAECITNLHVGSGDINYNIIDNEVEKDPVTGYPVVHASGFKGALREHFESKISEAEIRTIFGQKAGEQEISSGTYKFLDLCLISRPMRTCGAGIASVPVVSYDSVNAFLRLLNNFACNPFGIDQISPIDFGSNMFLTNIKNLSVEGDSTGLLGEDSIKELNMLESVIGKQYAVVKDFNAYDLPVVARNQLDNGISKNLWYEEIVPHNSVFCAIIITPDDQINLDMSDIIQVGGNASIGRGLMKFTLLN